MTSPKPPYNNEYYLMRHGESEANAAGLILSDPSIGVVSYGLTEWGRQEARESAERFAERGGIDIVYTSNFLRALETARIAAGVFRAGEPHVTPLLRERFFGELEGGSDGNYLLVWELDGENPDNRARGVESPADVAARAMKVLTRCESGHSGKRILLTAHGDILQILYCAANDIPVNRHRSIAPVNRAEIRALRSDSMITLEVL